MKRVQNIILGTYYNGQLVKSDILLEGNSIISNGGIGEDISFYLMMLDKHNLNVSFIVSTDDLKHVEEKI